MTIISASAARQTLPAQLDRVEAGEEVAITRHGRVVAILVNPAVLRHRRAATAWNEADAVGALLDEARKHPLSPPALSHDRAESLIHEMNADRSAP